MKWEDWLVRRATHYLLFAQGWSDPVEACLYAGYMGA